MPTRLWFRVYYKAETIRIFAEQRRYDSFGFGSKQELIETVTEKSCYNDESRFLFCLRLKIVEALVCRYLKAESKTVTDFNCFNMTAELKSLRLNFFWLEKYSKMKLLGLKAG